MPERGDSRRTLIELLVVLGLVEFGLWGIGTGRSRAWALVAYGGAAAVLAGSWLRRRPRGSPVRASAWRAWGEVLGATLALAILVALLGEALRDSYEEVELAGLEGFGIVRELLGELATAAVQQIPLQLFLAPVCLELVRREQPGRALAASLFGLLHLPNPALVATTAAGGWVWIGLYRRTGRLAPLIVSHAFLALCAGALVPERIHGGMRVGAAGLEARERTLTLGSEPVRALLRTLTSEAYYQAQGGNDRSFVEALYRDVLGRQGLPEEVDGWLEGLRSHSRAAVALGFVTSEEFLAIRRRLGDGYRFPFRPGEVAPGPKPAPAPP